VRYFLFQFPGEKTQNDHLLQWVSAHCGKVATNYWIAGDLPPGVTLSPDGEELFDCVHHS
jgi:hypothetical protein